MPVDMSFASQGDPNVTSSDLVGTQRKTLPNRITVIAFDDYVESTGPITVYTNPRLNWLVGLFDQIAIQIVTDDVEGLVPTLSAQVLHSADGRNWIRKYHDYPEISVTALSTVNTTDLYGFDDGAFPSLAFVCLSMTLGGLLNSRAHIKCTLTCNDVHEREFAREEWDYALGKHGCVQFIPGGGVMPTYAKGDPHDIRWLKPVFPNWTEWATDANMPLAEKQKAEKAMFGEHVGRWMVEPNDVGLGFCIKKDGTYQAWVQNPGHLTTPQLQEKFYEIQNVDLAIKLEKEALSQGTVDENYLLPDPKTGKRGFNIEST